MTNLSLPKIKSSLHNWKEQNFRRGQVNSVLRTSLFTQPQNTTQHIDFIYRRIFFSLYKCFSSALRSSAFIVIFQDKTTTKPQAVQFSTHHVSTCADRDTPDSSSYLLRILNRYFSSKWIVLSIL
jgi:hypothetical protein